jgi:hypothetical protein
MGLRLNGNLLYTCIHTQELAPNQSPDFLTFKEPKNRFQGTSSARLCTVCSLMGRYDNPIPTWFLAPVDCLKIPAQVSFQTVWVLFLPN